MPRHRQGRVTKLCEKAGYGRHAFSGRPQAPRGYHEAFKANRFDRALAAVWEKVAETNRDIEVTKPWVLLNEGRGYALNQALDEWLQVIHAVGYWLQPLLPEAAEQILDIVCAERIQAAGPLFPRVGCERLGTLRGGGTG